MNRQSKFQFRRLRNSDNLPLRRVFKRRLIKRMINRNRTVSRCRRLNVESFVSSKSNKNELLSNLTKLSRSWSHQTSGFPNCGHSGYCLISSDKPVAWELFGNAGDTSCWRPRCLNEPVVLRVCVRGHSNKIDSAQVGSV